MKVRHPAVAGSFYPDSPNVLARSVDAMLFEAGEAQPGRSPKALIVPHAGYIYSGPTAACGYALLDAEKITRVILLGPTHRVLLSGLALPEADAFETPLGIVELDQNGMAQVQHLAQVTVEGSCHVFEHSLEVHLPFLQRKLNRFTLVPFAVGQARPEMVAEVLDLLWGGEETLIVISSDLSHYHPYETARRIDAETADAIIRMQPTISHEQACGATPINGLLACTGKHPLRPELIDLRNSGDTAGPRDQVVGYGAFAFYE
ncbi:MAG: AmmeMemoRadiSam system protein B [Mariprofundaceae bacterium]|nr:AmmeMemoRadiSam system protein B [Mariprofundaceae bacterium]